MDYFTKGPEAYPIADQEASTVAEVLVQHWISRSGSLYNCPPIKGEISILQFARDCAKYSPLTKPEQQLCILRVPFTISLADLLSRPPDAPLASEEYIKKLQAWMEEIHHLARERIGMASEKMNTRYDARATGHDFREGDKV
ncbi:retrovirus-related Pol polyprotein from transposon 412 [Trichonephila clavipes]|nr:retrovirus-related Pol polyprotein from transposon 412 [Trichonephila clavipes]